MLALMVIKRDIALVTAEFGKGMHDRSVYHTDRFPVQFYQEKRGSARIFSFFLVLYCFFVVLSIFLTVLLREFNGNHLSAKAHTRLFRNERASGIGVTHELDEGEPLDSPIVGTVCVEILWNVDVTDGTVFLEERAQLIGRHVARQIASDERLDLTRIEQHRRRDLLNLHRSRARLDALEWHIEDLDLVVPTDTASILVLLLTDHRLAELIHHLRGLAFGEGVLVIRFILLCPGVRPRQLAIRNGGHDGVLEGQAAQRVVESGHGVLGRVHSFRVLGGLSMSLLLSDWFFNFFPAFILTDSRWL